MDLVSISIFWLNTYGNHRSSETSYMKKNQYESLLSRSLRFLFTLQATLGREEEAKVVPITKSLTQVIEYNIQIKKYSEMMSDSYSYLQLNGKSTDLVWGHEEHLIHSESILLFHVTTPKR